MIDKIFIKLYSNIKNNFKSKKGFSLVESLFAMVIGVMILGVVMVLQVGMQNSATIGIALADVNSEARIAMDNVIRDIRWGNQLETTHTIGSDTFVTGNDEIVVKVPSIDSSGTIIDSTFDYIVYYLDATDATILKRAIDPDVASDRTSTDRILVQDISSFGLSSGGVGLSSVGSLASVSSVDVAITAGKQPITGRTIDQTLNSSAELRNN